MAIDRAKEMKLLTKAARSVQELWHFYGRDGRMWFATTSKLADAHAAMFRRIERIQGKRVRAAKQARRPFVRIKPGDGVAGNA